MRILIDILLAVITLVALYYYAKWQFKIDKEKKESAFTDMSNIKCKCGNSTDFYEIKNKKQRIDFYLNKTGRHDKHREKIRLIKSETFCYFCNSLVYVYY